MTTLIIWTAGLIAALFVLAVVLWCVYLFCLILRGMIATILLCFGIDIFPEKL